MNRAPISRVEIIGGGIIGALEAYYAFKEAQKRGISIGITVYEKSHSFEVFRPGLPSTNTAYNIVPSLTIDEILSVIPRGSELIEKMAISFSQSDGIRVDDVSGVNDSEATRRFKESVLLYAADKNHEDRFLSLLKLGKLSMDLWQQIYDEGDAELKAVFKASNFHSCHESKKGAHKRLLDGYRIDLIYGIPQACHHALAMQRNYERLGYKNCTLLSPNEVMAIDPYLTDFCSMHSDLNADKKRVWKEDSAALWSTRRMLRQRVFLPKFYAYLKQIMGTYRDSNGQIRECFQLQFDSEVTSVELKLHGENLRVIGLGMGNRKIGCDKTTDWVDQYIFCPGEAVATLHKFGFHEPAYAAFAGASLFLNIPLSPNQINLFQNFSHYMEVHSEGIVLAWQARCKHDGIFIGVAGTRAFYGDKEPNKDEEFAKNKSLLLLNMINRVLPELMSLACGYNTKGIILGAEELISLEKKGIADRWVGRRAVAYDGFPTLGSLYYGEQRVSNARCTTHLGSSGVAFGPGAVFMSRNCQQHSHDPLIKKILKYTDSRVSLINAQVKYDFGKEEGLLCR